MKGLPGFFARLLLAAACGLPAVTWAGLASHEVAVLVNRNSLRSMEVANHFVHIRRVPARNVIYLDLPEHVLEPKAEFSPADFTRYIWEPAQAVLKERDLESHVLAWIYSVDFPVRITTKPGSSLMGMTFLRNRYPDDSEVIDKGLYRSVLFAGPDSEDGEMVVGGSLVHFKEALGDNMPLPSMMLGFTGARGTDTETVIRTIRYGQAADRSSPRGTVYWVTGDDVRARVREWQFPIAQKELQEMGVRSHISPDLPKDFPGIIGLQMGVSDFDIERAGRHIPGSMAEHLTSFAGGFDLSYQSKLTDWIRAGATASAGTVSEPYAAWTKFPHARFFSHYVRGNSMLESFYLSIRSPIQILLVGEPLTRPWSPPLSLTLVSLEDEPLKETATFMLAVFPEVPNMNLHYRIFVDGAHVSTGAGAPTFSFDTRDLADGYHELRAVSYSRGLLVNTVMNRIALHVSNQGRSVRITAPPQKAEVKLYEPIIVEATGERDPVRLQLIHNERVLAEADGDTARFAVDSTLIGAGPVQLHVRASYPDDPDKPVLSPPLDVVIQRPARHPALEALAMRDTRDARAMPDWEAAKPSAGSLTALGERGFLFEPNAEHDHNLILFDDKAASLLSYSATFTVAVPRGGHPKGELAGLVFGYQDAQNFNFFGLYGPVSAWTFGRYRNGRMEYVRQRGALILRDKSHALDLLFEGDTVTAYANGEPVATWRDPSVEQPGGWGVLAAKYPIQFEQIRADMAMPNEGDE